MAGKSPDGHLELLAQEYFLVNASIAVIVAAEVEFEDQARSSKVCIKLTLLAGYLIMNLKSGL